MTKIIAPNKDYNGISAGIKFLEGVGECADPYLIEWFKSKGYVVEDGETPEPVVDEAEAEEIDRLNNMTVKELKNYVERNGIDVGKSTSKDGILKKIRAAQGK
jgi:hypothetical protein